MGRNALSEEEKKAAALARKAAAEKQAEAVKMMMEAFAGDKMPEKLKAEIYKIADKLRVMAMDLEMLAR